MSKTSLACALMLTLGAACAGSNKTCPSDEMRPDQRTGQAGEGTSETVIPGDPSQERTIILIPVPDEAAPEGQGTPGNEGTPEDAVPAPEGEPQTGEDPQAPTIFLIPVEPDEPQPGAPQDGGGLQEDVVPDAPGDATNETQVPAPEVQPPAPEVQPPAPPDPKDIYF